MVEPGAEGILVVVVLCVHTEHDVGVHLHEASVRIPGEALVTRLQGKSDHGGVVESKVQDGVHHPRHGDSRARAHGDEQRVARIGEAAPDVFLDARERRHDFAFEVRRQFSSMLEEPGADFGRDRETRRDRKTQAAHLGQVRTLAAQQVAQSGVSVGSAFLEGEDARGRRPARVSCQTRLVGDRGDAMPPAVAPGRGGSVHGHHVGHTSPIPEIPS